MFVERNEFFKHVFSYVVHTTTYIVKKIPTKVGKNSTPYEARFCKKPIVSNLKIFGSTGFVHILAQQWKNLDGKSVKYIFIGYSKISKDYRCFDPLTNKIYVSRDVIFDEGGIYIKNEGEVIVISPHTRNLIYDNNDKYLKPSIVRNVRSPSKISPSKESPSYLITIYQVDTQVTPPSSPPRKERSLKEIYETYRYVGDNFLFSLTLILNLLI